MGQSPEGALIYGYALGGTEGGWRIKELTEEGDWAVAWAPKAGIDDDPDVLDVAERKILTEVIGFTEQDPHPNAYRDPGPQGPEWNAHLEWCRRRQNASERLKIIPHGYEFSEHALIAFEASAEWGEACPVDLAALEARRVAEGWDALLAKTIEILGITPVTIDDNNRWDLDAPREPVPPRWMVVAKYS